MEYTRIKKLKDGSNGSIGFITSAAPIKPRIIDYDDIFNHEPSFKHLVLKSKQEAMVTKETLLSSLKILASASYYSEEGEDDDEYFDDSEDDEYTDDEFIEDTGPQIQDAPPLDIL